MGLSIMQFILLYMFTEQISILSMIKNLFTTVCCVHWKFKLKYVMHESGVQNYTPIVMVMVR